jgi:hypothetical protein
VLHQHHVAWPMPGAGLVDEGGVEVGGDDIADGCAMIVDALAYETSGDGAVKVPPRFKVCECCRNIRFALATYTGADGQKGAVKDWIDLLRYFFRQGLALCKEADPREVARMQREAGERGQGTGDRGQGAGGGRQGTGDRGQATRKEVAGAGGRVSGGRMLDQAPTAAPREVARAGGWVRGGGARAIWRGRGVR